MGTMYVEGQWVEGIQNLTPQISSMMDSNEARLIGSQYLDEISVEVEGLATSVPVMEAAKSENSTKRMRLILVYRE